MSDSPTVVLRKVPRFNTRSNNLVAFWKGEWYRIRIVRNAKKRNAAGYWLYEIRWEGYANESSPGQLPSNESTYPENWIWRRGTIPRSSRGVPQAPEGTSGEPSEQRQRNSVPRASSGSRGRGRKPKTTTESQPCPPIATTPAPRPTV
eukprot:RCo016634